jgi:general secretion pathway protein C
VPAAAPQPPSPAPAPPSSPPAPAPSAEGLRLHGLLGGGAIIATADGRQRFVAIGREVAPGLRVARIEQNHVILASPGGELRLGFDGVSRAEAAASEATPAASASEEALRDETLRYRLGLAPRQVGGRATGFIVRPNVSMPALERAGMRPGDVIVGVNGSGFDEERMLELAWQIANSTRTEFEVERGGRRIRLAIER